MHNWRLLLLAVIAVLQPVPSFTENNLVDGGRECCGHRSTNIAPHTALHGTFRKPSSDHRRLDAHADVRKGQRYEARFDATTRSHNLAPERYNRRASYEFARSSIDSRFARDQERRFRHSFETRDGENRESRSRTTRQYEGDSRRVMVSEDKRTEVRGQDRSYRNSLETRGMQRARAVSELRQRTTHREERNNVVHTIRDRRITDGLDNNAKSSRIARSLLSDMRVVRSQNLPEERRSNIRTFFERSDERRKRDRELGDENRSNRRATSERVLPDRTNHNLRTEKRVDRFRNNIAHTDERLQRAALRQSNENNRESRLSPTTRKSQSERSEEIRRERFSRSAERNTDYRQTPTQSLEQVSLLREYREENILQSESNRRIRGHNFISSRREVRNVDRMDRSRQRESPITRDRYTLQVPTSRNIAERRQEYRNFASFTRMEARSDRDTRVRDLRNNERINVVRCERRAFTESENNRISCDNERRQERESTRISQLSQRSSHKQDSRVREDIRTDKRLDVRREVQEYNTDRTARQRLNPMETQTRRNTELASRDAQFTRIRSRTTEDIRNNNRRQLNEISKESRVRITVTRLSREIDEQRRDARTTVPSTGLHSDVIRHRDNVQMRERFEVRQDENPSLRESMSLQRASRGVRGTRSAIGQRNRDTSTRVRVTNERLTDNWDNRRTNERSVRDNRDFRAITTGLASRNAVNREILTNAPVFSLEREKYLNHNIRVQTNSDRTMDGRTNSRDTRFTELRVRNFESTKLKEVDEKSAHEQTSNWQMVLYTLQAAYVCGLLMKMLTEKSNKGKTGKTWWMPPKNVIKVD